MNRNFFQEALASVPNHVTLRVGWSFSIADKIDAKLKELGMSHREFAKRAGKTEPEVTRWLSGTHNFTLRTLAKISDALGENLIEV